MVSRFWVDTTSLAHRRRLLFGVLGMATAVAACGTTTTSPSTSGSPNATAAKCGTSSSITLNLTDYSTTNNAFYKQVESEYQSICPNVTINWVTVAQSTYYQDIGIELAGSNPPDIFFYKAGDLNEYQEGTMDILLREGLIQPLDPNGNPPLSWTGEWGKNGEEGFVNGINQANGKVYTFPYTDSVNWGDGYMYYNKSVFSAAGISTPPKTWSDLESDCTAIKKLGKSCISATLDSSSDFDRLWYAFAGAIQTDSYFDLKTGQFDLTEPNMVKAFDEIQTLYKEGYISGTTSTNSGAARQALVNGSAGIYFDGAWMPGVFTNTYKWSADNWGVAGDPRPDSGPDGGWDAANTQNEYFVSKGSKNAAAAWAFIQWMTQPDGWFVQNYYTDGLGFLSYADNSKYLSDIAHGSDIHTIATATGPAMRVVSPEPITKCPALADSSAFSDANAVLGKNDALYNAFVDSLTQGKDYTTEVGPLVTQAQSALTSGLTKEKSLGLAVSISCFQYPNWNYDQNYTGS